jgi:hypothetical protein
MPGIEGYNGSILTGIALHALLMPLSSTLVAAFRTMKS